MSVIGQIGIGLKSAPPVTLRRDQNSSDAVAVRWQFHHGVRSVWEWVTSQLKPLCLPCCRPCSMGTGCCLNVKAYTFLCLLNLQKLTQTASKCTNVVYLRPQLEGQWFSLENDTKFGLRGMPGGSYMNRLKMHLTSDKCMSHLFQWEEPWLREGSLGSWTQPQTCT